MSSGLAGSERIQSLMCPFFVAHGEWREWQHCQANVSFIAVQGDVSMDCFIVLLQHDVKDISMGYKVVAFVAHGEACTHTAFGGTSWWPLDSVARETFHQELVRIVRQCFLASFTGRKLAEIFCDFDRFNVQFCFVGDAGQGGFVSLWVTSLPFGCSGRGRGRMPLYYLVNFQAERNKNVAFFIVQVSD